MNSFWSTALRQYIIGVVITGLVLGMMCYQSDDPKLHSGSVVLPIIGAAAFWPFTVAFAINFLIHR